MRHSGGIGIVAVTCGLAIAGPAVAKAPTRKEVGAKIKQMISAYDHAREDTHHVVADLPGEIKLCDVFKKVPDPPKAGIDAIKSYGDLTVGQLPPLEKYNAKLGDDVEGLESGGPPSGAKAADWNSAVNELKTGHDKHSEEFRALKAAGEALEGFGCDKAHTEYAKAAIAGDFAWSSLSEGAGLAHLAELTGVTEKPQDDGDVYP